MWGPPQGVPHGALHVMLSVEFLAMFLLPLPLCICKGEREQKQHRTKVYMGSCTPARSAVDVGIIGS